jgi:uncharacterized protein
MVEDEVVFYGHPNIRSLHLRAIEVTKNPNLTLRGDCIIGVRANKACKDLNPILQRLLKKEDSVIRISIIAGNLSYIVKAFGHSRLLLLDAQDIVIRKTNFMCSRTLCIKSDSASQDVPREIVRWLQDPENRAVLKIYAE